MRHAVPVQPYGQRRLRQLGLKPDPAGVHIRPHHVAGPLHKLVQPDIGQVQHIGARKIEEIAHHLVQAEHLPRHDVSHAAFVAAFGARFHEETGQPLNGTEGVADLMGDARRHIAERHQTVPPPQFALEAPDFPEIAHDQSRTDGFALLGHNVRGADRQRNPTLTDRAPCLLLSRGILRRPPFEHGPYAGQQVMKAPPRRRRPGQPGDVLRGGVDGCNAIVHVRGNDAHRKRPQDFRRKGRGFLYELARAPVTLDQEQGNAAHQAYKNKNAEHDRHMLFVGGLCLLKGGEIILDENNQRCALGNARFQHAARVAVQPAPHHPVPAAMPAAFPLRDGKLLIHLEYGHPIGQFRRIPFDLPGRIELRQNFRRQETRADEFCIGRHQHGPVTVGDHQRNDVRLFPDLVEQIAQHFIGPVISHTGPQRTFQRADERRRLFKGQLRREIRFAFGVVQPEHHDPR